MISVKGDVYIGNVFLQFQERTHETVPFTVHSSYRTCDIYQCSYHFGHATFYQYNYHFGYFVGELNSQVGRRATMSCQENCATTKHFFNSNTLDNVSDTIYSPYHLSSPSSIYGIQR